MRWLRIGIFIILAVLLSAFIVLRSFLTDNTSQAKKYDITIGEKIIRAEIADNETLREKGLSGKTRLNDDQGMLFTFPRKKVLPVFWMKGMLIPIDIVWISGNKIVKIDGNVQPPLDDTPDNELPKYQSFVPVDYVLELPGGFSVQNNVKAGDEVIINLK